MRSYVCGQCHVEYYFAGPAKTLTYPWAKGLRVEEIEAYYDEQAFTDFTHAETGAPVLKAQHPEFEVWNQGVHARAGVACADCHMPFQRVGALKVSDHWVRSPLLNVNRACQPCHAVPEAELQARVGVIQDRHHALLERAATATTDLLDTIVAAKRAGADDAALAQARALQRRAQWRLDFVAAENSMGFHAPQELARILAETIDYARQGRWRRVRARQPPSRRDRLESGRSFHLLPARRAGVVRRRGGDAHAAQPLRTGQGHAAEHGLHRPGRDLGPLAGERGVARRAARGGSVRHRHGATHPAAPRAAGRGPGRATRAGVLRRAGWKAVVSSCCRS